MSDLHVYEIASLPGSRLLIGQVEGRVRPVLALQHGGGTAILASFHSDQCRDAAVAFFDHAFDDINRVIAHYAAKHGETTEHGHAEGTVQGDGAEGARAEDRSPYLEGGGGEPNAG